MDSRQIENMLRQACNTPALCKLNALVRELTGVGLLVVWSRGGECFRHVPVCDNERDLPQFCRLLHEVPQGLQRCVTCHSLLARPASEEAHNEQVSVPQEGLCGEKGEEQTTQHPNTTPSPKK